MKASLNKIPAIETDETKDIRSIPFWRNIDL